MKIVVYPHDLGMGGSQTNAIELAGAVRDLGHEVIVFGQPGPLTQRIGELDLEFVAAPNPRVRPSPAIVSTLHRLVTTRALDIVHGYEWPPGVHAALAVTGTRAAPVCTVMSMSVAPFLPRSLPLVVGTHQIAESERRSGRLDVTVIEPPVDLDHNALTAAGGDPRAALPTAWGIEPGTPLVVLVTRLAAEMKLEGVLCATDVVPTLPGRPQLLIVGDGPGRAQVEAAARRANEKAGRRAVLLTGQVADPRAAYAAATVVLGMGGSALRGLAFGRPLVVQGEQGFWRTLTPESADRFLVNGWYGVGEGVDSGPARLRQELVPLLADAALRRQLGAWGHDLVVDRYSLTRAARVQVALYEQSIDSGVGRSARDLVEQGRAAGAYAVHALRRKRARRRGLGADDFNRKPVAAAEAVRATFTGAMGAPDQRRAHEEP